jgi:hypothetical protein
VLLPNRGGCNRLGPTSLLLVEDGAHFAERRRTKITQMGDATAANQ